MPLFTRKRAKPSVITLADWARDAGQWELAAMYYRTALRRKPKNPPIWVQYGHVLSRQSRNQTSDSGRSSTSAVRAILDDPPIHIRRIYAYCPLRVAEWRSLPPTPKVLSH